MLVLFGRLNALNISAFMTAGHTCTGTNLTLPNSLTSALTEDYTYVSDT